MRPIKPRFIDGIQLADNLYSDPKKRPGFYRYVRKDGTTKIFQADSVDDANAVAIQANERRDEELSEPEELPERFQIAFHIPEYVRYIEKINPSLRKKESWKNSKYAFNQFARAFQIYSKVTHETIKQWWDELSHHQQKTRQAAFRRWFNWLMGEGLIPKIKFNPFTLSDDVSRLLVKLKPDKKRPPCTQIGFRKIYRKAPELGYECLQIAMGISLYTTMREGDICSLQFKKHIVDGKLQVVIQKSEAQRGAAKAARLSWTLSEHPVLKKLIDRARELALINKGCPFIVSHTPITRAWNHGKEHICQVLPERLYRMFVEVAESVDLPKVVFHEVRGLASTLYRVAGYENTEIQKLMAHESVETTIGYQDPDELPFQEITMRLNVEL